MLKKSTIILISCLMAVCAAWPVWAGNRAGSFNLTPLAGMYVFEGDQNVYPGPAFGLAVGYNLTEYFGLEGMYTICKAESEGGFADAVGHAYHFDALYHFRPQSNLVPYLALHIVG